MNYLQKQFKRPVSKNIVLIILLLFTHNTSLYSQAVSDSSVIQELYESTKRYYTSGNYEKAIMGLREILKIKKNTGIDTEPKYFKVYNRLGLVYKKQGDLQKAIDFYKKALENISDIYIKSIINGNIANIYTLIGDYSKAVYYYDNTLLILEKSDEQKKYQYIVDNYHNQGYAYYKSGQLDMALQRSLKSIQIVRENRLKITGDTYYNCGLIYQKLDSLNKADFYFKKAVETCEKESGTGNYVTAMAYINYAVFCAKIGQLTKSKELFETAYPVLLNILGKKHLFISYYYKHLGNFYFKKKKYEKALNLYQQALIAKIYEFNDTSTYSNPGKGIYPDMDLLILLNAKARALEKLATIENRQKNLEIALQTLKLNVDFIEQLRAGYLYESSKLTLAQKEHETYKSIVNISYLLYKITGNKEYAETAFKHAELSKYAILRELENEEKAMEIAGIPDSLQEKERELKEQITYLGIQLKNVNELQKPDRERIEEYQQKIFKTTKELETFYEKLETTYPLYKRQKYQNIEVNSTRIQESIAEKDAILEYVLTDSLLFTFVLTKNHFVFDKQSIDSVFYTNLDFYTKVLYREHLSNYYEYRNAAYYLYKSLVLPYENLIQNKNLVIIPDGKLLQISFDALIDKPYKETDNPDYRKESYLIRKYALSYAYSATLYRSSLNAERSLFQNFLGIAPGYENSKDSLIHLPLGIRNVKKLALLTFGKSFTGDKATKENFNKNAYKSNIIHFYAHGLEDTLSPANSKLYLSPSDTTNNGYLYAWEIYNMQLHANLVVLAACYSGKGKFSKGEGVLSIARSFIHAGSKSIITSLWSASYIPANMILTEFYSNSFKGKSKSESLQMAKLKFLEETNSYSAHPMFWSGIVLYGNSTTLYHGWYLKRIVALLSLIFIVIVIIKRSSLFKFP